MYSEQLEQLIQSVIADGVVTEKERAVLHKRAAAEGVDEDEINVYVDALLAKVEPKEKVPKKYNLSVFNKVQNNGGDTCDLFQKFYKITSSCPKPVKEILIAFADVMPPSNNGIQTDEEGINDIDAEIAAGLLSIKPKKCKIMTQRNWLIVAIALLLALIAPHAVEAQNKVKKVKYLGLKYDGEANCHKIPYGSRFFQK